MQDEEELEDSDDCPPSASGLIHTLSSFGYTLPTAVADIIDNSITAKCRNVWVQFTWEKENSWLSITDDGKGMTEKELINAMRPGSQSPLEEREASDLGRFGLGLKTASFSQAQRLTVISRASGKKSALRRWDLDYLVRKEKELGGRWPLLRKPHKETGDRAKGLGKKKLKKGTQVLLEALNRVAGVISDEREEDREDHFLGEIELVREHLAMVFHRFLEKGKVKIILNGKKVKPWDPFVSKHVATSFHREDSRKCGGHAGSVKVKAYVLPHRDRFESHEEHKAAGGPDGWNAQQGFYLYRENRLIISGDWLGLGWSQEEHYKLARICLDVPNSMDHDWKIEVKKSTAEPPAVLRKWLRGIARDVRDAAKKVYAHRGKYGVRKKRSKPVTSPWKSRTSSSGEFSYRIDRRHPVLKPLIKSLSDSGKKDLEALLRLIEELVPVQRIWIDTADNPDGTAGPFTDGAESRLRQVIQTCLKAQVETAGLSREDALDVLAGCEAFQGERAMAIIGQFREGNGS